MSSPANPHLPRRSGRGLAKGGEPTAKGGEPTAALFVRIPTEHARRLDRAAFELRVPKQSLVSELVERYVNPDSPASLMALGRGWGTGFATGSSGVPAPAPAPAPAEALAEARNADSRRRVTVETLDQGELTVGHHSFRPRDPEVLTPDEAAELLQVDPDVVLDLARGGELPGRELAGEWRFARVALLAWLANGTADADAKG